MKKIHIIAVCGKGTASIAVMMKNLGWEVTGSDQNVFPPASTLLEANDIKILTPFSPDNIYADLDLVMVGGGALIMDKQNPEVTRARELGLRLVSFPEVLKEFLVKENSIVFTGAYGKTTMTALCSHIFTTAGHNPSFFIGDVPLNFDSGIINTNSNVSILEGDEHPTLGFDERPKFIHMQPTVAVVSSLKWDHINVYPTHELYKQAYKDLVKLLPDQGKLIYCKDGDSCSELDFQFKGEIITYSTDDISDFQAENIKLSAAGSEFSINGVIFKSPLLGKHNVQNAAGVYAVSKQFGISDEQFQVGLSSFLGVKRRLEVKFRNESVTVIDDLAHSAIKIRETLRSLASSIDTHKTRIIAIFDPHQSGLKEKETLTWWDDVFAPASQVCISKLISTQHGIVPNDLVKAISNSHINVKYYHLDDVLVDHLADEAELGDCVIIFLSSGGIRGMIDKLVDRIK